MDPKKIDRIKRACQKEKNRRLDPRRKVEQAKLREEYIEGYVALFVTTSKESKLWTKKETMLHQRNYVKFNVKKDYMVVVSMTQIHNKYSFF